MRTALRVLLIVAVVALTPLVGYAQTTSTSTSSTTSTSTSLAVTWLVVRNADCTAAQAATGLTAATVNCCTAAGQGFCDKMEAIGAQFSQHTTIVSGGTGGYTTGGDAINTANLNKIKVGNIESMECGASTAGHSVYPKFTANSGKRGPTLMLFNGTTQISAAANISGLALECRANGH